MSDAGPDMTPAASGLPPVPTELRLSADGGVLRLVWPADAVDAFAAPDLRAACRCADCMRLRHDGRFPAAFPEVTIDTLDLVGAQAVNIRFSDGHGRGIYPWAYLREIALAKR